MSTKPYHSDPMLPPYSNFCQCSECGEYFGGVSTFDLHRRGKVDRFCLPPSEVTDKEGNTLLRKNDRGYWVRNYETYLGGAHWFCQ